MSAAPAFPELFFVLDPQGGLVAFRENLAPWAGVVMFSSEAAALQFCRDSGAHDATVAAVATSDADSLRAIIGQVKLKGIRYLLLDLDYRQGTCIRYELEGDWFGTAQPHRFTPAAH